jgi:N6-adenosine-specific RNA methylase IME4
MPYRTIVVDPPWPIRWSGGWRKAGASTGSTLVHAKRALAYPTMTIEAIAALPVRELAEADAHLYLWVPDHFLIEGVAAHVCRAWGFEPGRLLVWHKSNYGLGTFPRPQHEALVLAKRGTLAYRVRDVGSVQFWRAAYQNGARVHSRKPDAALDLIEQASYPPYVELFARRHRLGWDVWGDESANTAEWLGLGTGP